VLYVGSDRDRRVMNRHEDYGHYHHAQ
jgi:hypothetical protein